MLNPYSEEKVHCTGFYFSPAPLPGWNRKNPRLDNGGLRFIDG